MPWPVLTHLKSKNMKKPIHTITVLLLIATVYPVYAQVDSTEREEEAIEEVEEIIEEIEINDVDTDDDRIIIHGDNGEEVIVDGENSTIIIHDGEERIIIDGRRGKIVVKEKIIHRDYDGNMDSIMMHEGNWPDSMEREIRIERSFFHEDPEKEEFELVTTDWFNMQIGLNNMLNANDELEMPAGFENMEVSTGKSINFQIHFVQQAINIYRDNIRLVYGLGLDINNYRFDQDVILGYDSMGGLQANLDTDTEYKKNKLVTQYLTVPLMLNLKLGRDDDKSFKLSFGPNFGYLINSHQKLKWSENGKQKSKIKDDYNIEKFRMGYELQFGYGPFILFGKYYPNSMFKQDLGPDLRTVSAGILIGSI